MEECSKSDLMPNGDRIMEGLKIYNPSITNKQISPEVSCFSVSISVPLPPKEGTFYMKFRTGRHDQNEWLVTFHLSSRGMLSTYLSVRSDLSIESISTIVILLEPFPRGPYECDFIVDKVQRILDVGNVSFGKCPIKMSLAIFEKIRTVQQVDIHEKALDVLFTNRADVCLNGSGWERPYLCHKSVIYTRLPTFQHVLNKESLTYLYHIDMSFVEPEIVKSILVYIYTGTPVKLDEYAEGLLNAASTLKIRDLKNLCEKQLSENTTVDNVCERFILAENSKSEKLRRRCIALMMSRKDVVTKTKGWFKLRRWNTSLTDAIIQNTLTDRKHKEQEFIDFAAHLSDNFFEENYINLIHYLNHIPWYFNAWPQDKVKKVVLLIFIYLAALPTITQFMPVIIRFTVEYLMYVGLYKLIYSQTYD